MSLPKEFADDNLNLIKMAESSPEQVENAVFKRLVLNTHKNMGLFGKWLIIVGKRENAGLPNYAGLN